MHPEPDGWTRRRTARTEEIVTAALRIVATEGVDALTVARLAHSIGMTQGALYRYFPSKSAIIAELNHRVVTRWTSRLGAAVQRASGEGGPLLVLIAAGVSFVAAAFAEPDAFALVAVTAADARVLVKDDIPKHLPALLDALEQIGGGSTSAVAVAALLPGDPRARATTLIFGLLGLITVRKLERFEPAIDTERLCHDLIRDLLRGWGASDTDLEQGFQTARRLVALQGADREE